MLQPEELSRDPDRDAALARYEASLNEVPGWLESTDFVLLQLIDAVQASLGLRGDILEIGAYQGRTAILLQYLCRDNEQLAVCDVFDQPLPQEPNQRERDVFYTDLTRHSFEQHFLRYHQQLPSIHQCLSEDLEDHLQGQEFRLIHVDGSHVYTIVKSDLRTARSVLARGGVVAIDDYRSEHTPGVAAATGEATAGRQLLPASA